ncbi:DUF1254 domain-containing protein [Eudoraea sp.]|uniref:DUF1254 domain-containing protein n=1 Tax=Eudoraea sp. TaxID=1979955 RepID=UPI003C713D3B
MTKEKSIPMKTIWVLLVGLILNSCNLKNELTPDQAKEIAKEAYIYGFPLVVNYKTLYAYTLDKNSTEYKGEFNIKSCEARVYTPNDKAIVTPNSDTPYCMFWSDISKEPVVFSVPEMEAERYYSFQFIDLFTHNFAYIGTLSTGNKAGKYLIASSSWEGDKPKGIIDIIRCESDLFFTIVRTQLMDENDLNKVEAIQDEYQIQLLSSYLGKEAVKAADKKDWPVWNEGDQFTEASFKYIDVVLNLTEKIESETALREKFAKLGIGTSEPFDFESFEIEIQEAIKTGVKEGFAEMEEFIKQHGSDPLGSTKMFGTRSFLNQSAKENYELETMFILRAVVAHLGLYGNSAAEATYPTYLVDNEGNGLDAAENNYTITFGKTELPPVKAFWSFTMYDGKTQLLIDNPLNRYLLNSPMMDDFVMNEDGSLTLYMQKESPGAALEANWLPAPDGPFYAVMRLYGPKEEALKGTWINPQIVKNN